MKTISLVLCILLSTTFCFAQSKKKAPEKEPSKLNEGLDAMITDQLANGISKLGVEKTDLDKCIVDLQNSSVLDVCQGELLEAQKKYLDFLNNPENQKEIEKLVKHIKTTLTSSNSMSEDLSSYYDIQDDITLKNSDGEMQSISLKNLFAYFKTINEKLQAQPDDKSRTQLLESLETTSIFTSYGIKLNDAIAAVNQLNEFVKRNPEIAVTKTKSSVSLMMNKPVPHNTDTLGKIRSATNDDGKTLVSGWLSSADLSHGVDYAVWKIIKRSQMTLNGIPIDGDLRWDFYLNKVKHCKEFKQFHQNHVGPYVSFKTGTTTAQPSAEEAFTPPLHIEDLTGSWTVQRLSVRYVFEAPSGGTIKIQLVGYGTAEGKYVNGKVVFTDPVWGANANFSMTKDGLVLGLYNDSEHYSMKKE